MDTLLATQLWGGQTFGDLVTLEFVVAILGDLLTAILILVVGYVFAGVVRRRLQGLSARHASLDKTLFGFLANVAWYSIVAFAVLFVLNTFGIQTTSVVAIVGAAGLAVGLALQGTLSNIAAGVMIVFFRPMRVGDFVEVSGQMGTVQSITLNYTELATVGNFQVIVPNAQVWGNTIVNYSAYDMRRAEWAFGVSYDADLKLAEQVIRDTILSDPRSKAEPAPFVQVNNLGAYSVDFLVRVWVDAADYFAYQADMKRAVKEALDKAGVEIPFPTRTVVTRDD